MKSKEYCTYHDCRPWVRRLIDLKLGVIALALYILLAPLQVILAVVLSLISPTQDAIHSVISGFKDLKNACKYRKENP